MNNNPNCNKTCLDCYHCEPRCIQSCRDCHRCKTFPLERKGLNHPIPRDMLLLTRKREMENFNNSQISDVQPSDSYVPTPLYCQTKKCLQRNTKEENAKTIMNSDVGLCYFCDRKDVQKPRTIFPPDALGRANLSFSEYGGGEITRWSVL